MDSLELLCDPNTRDPLETSDAGLVNVRTGTRFEVREGIPVFAPTPANLNLKYQKMYDRLAPGYDIAERLYHWIFRKPDYRLDYIQDLEIPSAGRVLEVSIGTGANLKYFPTTVEYFGLDLSWGMLRRAVVNGRRWGGKVSLFQGEAEHLPFRDAIFDCVFHVGGINFFNDKPRAISEMIRVAKPGSKIVIVDETEKVVTGDYRSNPLTRKYFADHEVPVACPIDLVPDSMREVQARQITRGKLYCLSFRKP
jgi:ubiquinone/menaquinone biosynthesis C-methylase UbiE